MQSFVIATRMFITALHKLTICLFETRAGRSGDRIPVEVRFSAPVQTGPGAHPYSCTMGNGSLPGVKWPGRGFDYPPPYSAGVKEIVELYFYSPLGLLGLFWGERFTAIKSTSYPHILSYV